MKKQYYRRFIDAKYQYRRWVDARYRTLRLADVSVYLLDRGWKPLLPDRDSFLIFQEPSGELVNGQPLCQFVPDSERHDDYAARMFEFLTGLAEVEDRQVSEVIDDILALARQRELSGAGRDQFRDTEVTTK
jgi:hypothetical protein